MDMLGCIVIFILIAIFVGLAFVFEWFKAFSSVQLINTGVTRHVILIDKYAVKIPRLNYGWRLFLTGLLCNMTEVSLSTMKDNRLCPVIFSINGGWFLVMPKCTQLSKSDFEKFDYNTFDDYRTPEKDFCYLKGSVENKQDSFGWLDNKIVALDYGN